MKDQILNRVTKRMEALGLKDRTVGMRATGKPDVIRNWRNKDVLPRLDTLMQVAQVLETTPEWLTYGVGSDGIQSVPKISWVSAGEFGVTDGIMDFEVCDHITVADLPVGQWVALTVDGDSMDRISPPGSIIIANRADKKLIPNACYIILDGEGGATYKRYRQSPLRFEPVSTNPNHEPFFVDQNSMPEVFGRVHRCIVEI